MAVDIRNLLGTIHHHIKLNLYRWMLPIKIKSIRKKNIITVLYVLSELSSWKTEMLFQAMMRHHRFHPIIGVSSLPNRPEVKQQLVDYLLIKGYEYVDLDAKKNSIKIINPDLITYHKPYGCYSEGHYYKDNLQYVFFGLNYGFAIAKNPVHQSHAMFDYCWQFYVENAEVAAWKKKVLGYRANNVCVTGVPMQDALLENKESFDDPWIDKTGKKRIIYAPHHSIKGTNGEGVELSTFLDFGEPLLEFAKKYCNDITIAFKPHPNLYSKLVAIWGQERTDSYYSTWKTLPNTLLVLGEYMGLFKYSDAIIHDSASFLLEYLYMNNPSMYLVIGEEDTITDGMYDYVKRAFDCYEKGHRKDEIESFIHNIIQGKDINKVERGSFVKAYLLPPGGKTACSNIIDSLLGVS